MFFEKIYELFDFRRHLRENLENHFTSKSVSGSPPHPEHITVFDGDAVRRITGMLFDKDNFLQYRSFLQYKIICAFKNVCTKEINDEFFDFYLNKLTGQLQQKSEDKRSIQDVNALAGEMMGKVYVDHYFPEAY